MENPGGFRIEIDAAKSGGISDPRNGTMLNMFHLIDISERTGSGIPNIFRVWREQGWAMPSITEQIEPARTLLVLPLEKTGRKKSVMKIGEPQTEMDSNMKEAIMVYLTDHPQAKASEIAEYIGLKPSRTKEFLNQLISEEVVVAEGRNRNQIYKLKT